MGGEAGNRCKSTHSESIAPSDLVVCFMREVDTANAYVIELQDAVARKDRRRCATTKAALHDAWTNAQGALTKLEQLSGHREVHARVLLEQSQASARPALDALWELVKKRSGSY
jgi:hypothetical protein